MKYFAKCEADITRRRWRYLWSASGCLRSGALHGRPWCADSGVWAAARYAMRTGIL